MGDDVKDIGIQKSKVKGHPVSQKIPPDGHRLARNY